ncbi:MAG: ATPase [Alphaproteobacteria bacterium]|nr:ATPase [Alphaproteobacteria bacterium]
MSEENTHPDKPVLPKRFYDSVSVEEVATEGTRCWRLLLDGRAVKSPAKTTVEVPCRELAELLAGEWRAQGERIDPETMPMTKIVNSGLDGVSGREEDVAADIVSFAGSDLVCYRAEDPVDLVALQAKAWDPIIGWAREALGARFVLAEGVMPVEQPVEALQAVAKDVAGFNALQLAALHVLTTLSGSALISLAHARGAISAEEAWAIAHVDEDFQITQWGADEEARLRREKRGAEFAAASRVLKAL